MQQQLYQSFTSHITNYLYKSPVAGLNFCFMADVWSTGICVIASHWPIWVCNVYHPANFVVILNDILTEHCAER
jgi:hypothetical protein